MVDCVNTAAALIAQKLTITKHDVQVWTENVRMVAIMVSLETFVRKIKVCVRFIYLYGTNAIRYQFLFSITTLLILLLLA